MYTSIYFLSFYVIWVQNWRLNDIKEKISRVEVVQKDSGARAQRAGEKDLSRARVPIIPFLLPFQRLRLKKK